MGGFLYNVSSTKGIYIEHGRRLCWAAGINDLCDICVHLLLLVRALAIDL